MEEVVVYFCGFCGHEESEEKESCPACNVQRPLKKWIKILEEEEEID